MIIVGADGKPVVARKLSVETTKVLVVAVVLGCGLVGVVVAALVLGTVEMGATVVEATGMVGAAVVIAEAGNTLFV